jgi:hypothetical protein
MNEKFSPMPDIDLLARFILHASSKPDTPSLIRLVASDRDYPGLCSAVVEAEPGTPGGLYERLTLICRQKGVDFSRLREKLVPVAASLGLIEGKKTDYYGLLGISPGATGDDIKSAYRRRAREVHPDTHPGSQQDPKEFLEISRAYRTLLDPEARRKYDAQKDSAGHWHERPHKETTVKKKKARHVFHFTAVFLLLVLFAFLFDRLYQQSALTDLSFFFNGKSRHLPETRKETGGTRAREEIRAPDFGIPYERVPSEPENLDLLWGKKDSSEAIDIHSDPWPSLMKAPQGMTPPFPEIVPPEVLVRTGTDSRVSDLHKYKVTVYYNSRQDWDGLLRLSAFLESKGYETPLLVRLNFVHGTSDVRYFHPMDREGALIFREEIQDDLQIEFGIDPETVQLKDFSEVYGDVERGTLELWMDGLVQGE